MADVTETAGANDKPIQVKLVLLGKCDYDVYFLLLALCVLQLSMWQGLCLSVNSLWRGHILIFFTTGESAVGKSSIVMRFVRLPSKPRVEISSLLMQ